MNEIILELKQITKIFPHSETPIIANNKIDFELQKGEIHALVGENGSGKTTLMNIVYGLLSPDSGQIFVNGNIVHFKNPRDAIKHGIGMVHQHFMLIPIFTVAENLLFGNEPRKLILIDKEKQKNITKQISEKYNLYVEPDALLSTCPLGMQQRVEILKLLLYGANILIFDEPTAVLTIQEVKELFGAFRALKKEGKSIIFITHKLPEVMAISDRATILRRGKVIDTVRITDVTIDDLAEKMVGRRVDLTTRKGLALHQNIKQRNSKDVEPILSIQDLSTNSSMSCNLSHISFSLSAGEIIGIGGVGGNGQDQLIQCITGLYKDKMTGIIKYHSIDISSLPAYKIRDLGLAYITGDRYGRGVSIRSTVHENLIMGAHKKSDYRHGQFLNQKKLRDLSASLIDEYGINVNSQFDPIMDLSGGNIQKCVFAREFSQAKDLIIAEEPTRGIDIGSTEFIHNQLIEKAEKGFAILLVSSDLDEILSLSTKIYIMFRGAISKPLSINEKKLEEQIGLLMAGIGFENIREDI